MFKNNRNKIKEMQVKDKRKMRRNTRKTVNNKSPTPINFRSSIFVVSIPTSTA